MTGQDVVNFAKTLIGRKYILGAEVPKWDSKYTGPYDCAEFCAYCNYQVFNILYGCSSDDIKKIKSADAYTGYFKRDAENIGKIISVQEATITPGAMLLRYPLATASGHIVFTQGHDAKTVEAHSTAMGCIESSSTGRRFDIGVLLPGVDYTKADAPIISKAPAIVYRLKTPMMKDPYIAKVQKALHIATDEYFGWDTFNALVNYQKLHDLIVDGEIMPGGQTARSLGII